MATRLLLKFVSVFQTKVYNFSVNETNDYPRRELRVRRVVETIPGHMGESGQISTQFCLLFRVRSRIVDVKEFHHYKYPEDNRGCRACGQSIETLTHVLGECNTLHSPTCDVGDEYSEDLSVLEKVVVRTQEFMDKVEELEEL